jgi:2-polyprenyl-3-methyl-5-hydroxy-6-metoxy-1,4-benzoquinol methylase
MIYLPDTPSLTDIDEFYNAYGNFKGFQGRHLSKTNWFIRSFFNPFVNILNSSGGLSGKRLLDVGCSYGDFLQLVKRRGAKIQGVELDGHALAHLKSVDIPASNQMPVNQQFDIVCAFQILEHLVDPDDFIAKLSDLLVEDGRLLLTLPNGGEAEQIGSSWIGFRVDYEHLNYFSSRSLSALLIKNNLYVENVWTYSHPGVSRVSVEPNRMLSKLNRMINIYLEREPDVIKGNFVLAVMARKVN